MKHAYFSGLDLSWGFSSQVGFVMGSTHGHVALGTSISNLLRFFVGLLYLWMTLNSEGTKHEQIRATKIRPRSAVKTKEAFRAWTKPSEKNCFKVQVHVQVNAWLFLSLGTLLSWRVIRDWIQIEKNCNIPLPFSITVPVVSWLNLEGTVI